MYMFTVCKCIKDDNNSEGEKERQRNVSTKCERRSKDAHIQDRKKTYRCESCKASEHRQKQFPRNFPFDKMETIFRL